MGQHKDSIIIMNPTSGASRGDNNLELAARLAEEYGDELYLSKSADDAYRTAARAAREGRKLIMAAGGDDTVRQVLHGIYGPDSPLRPGKPEEGRPVTEFGILPLGTFNNFATFLRIPRDMEKAWRLAHEGTLHWVDLGWIDGLIFTESIGVGMDVEAWKAFEEKPSMWRRILDGAVAVLRALMHYRSRRLRVEVDGEVTHVKAFNLTVANCERFSAAFSIAPHAVMDNGKLDLCILPAQSKLSFLFSLPLIFFGQHTRVLKDLTYKQATEILISARSPYAVRVDGTLARRLPVRVRSLAGALPIRLDDSTLVAPPPVPEPAV